MTINMTLAPETIRSEFADLRTGEMVNGVLITNPEEYTIISKKKEANRKEFLRRQENKELFEDIAGKFTFTLSSTIKELNQDTRFSPAEKTRIMFLGTYVAYQEQGNYLRHDNGHLIYKNKLQELLEIKNRKEFYAFYNKLVSAGIIIEEVENRTTIKLKWSNKYHFKGKAPAAALKEKNLIKTFDHQIRELYKEKNENGKSVHTPNNLYTLFMVIPYIHPETNVLCKYPEKPFDQCEPFTLTELAEAFGFNRTNDLKRKLLKVLLKGLPVFSIQQNAFYTYILVNPFVVWRSNKAPSEALTITFLDTAQRLLDKRYKKSQKNVLQR